jgi:hypothetical protein
MYTQLTQFYSQHALDEMHRLLKQHDFADDDIPTEFLKLLGVTRWVLNQAQNGLYHEYEELLDWLDDMLDYYIYNGNDCFGYTKQTRFTTEEISNFMEGVYKYEN